ncbi:MAG TPA: hypothetical protein PK611_08455 [Saprospiraceae bacterium]|nr:hypothetical protein [Saprospiraceae bacterium]HRO08228.1 hypothetical protein [Saprospiraceae bacterium]HRO73686.1 hypothetical protein [Saprospiraceae bacterium]HRP41119.1 hypothetical protein [Saprospiraceae bacterium]
MKTKLFTVLAFVFLFSVSSYAQDYKSAIGLRFGYPLSASYKTFLSEKGAFEGVAGFRSFSGYSWFNIGAYYQVHNDIGSVNGLKWYYGAGANVYFWSYDTGFAGDGSTSIGISGVLGLDYKFANIPLNVSVDWIPTYFINGYGSGFAGGYGALAARYVLN